MFQTLKSFSDILATALEFVQAAETTLRVCAANNSTIPEASVLPENSELLLPGLRLDIVRVAITVIDKLTKVGCLVSNTVQVHGQQYEKYAFDIEDEFRTADSACIPLQVLRYTQSMVALAMSEFALCVGLTFSPLNWVKPHNMDTIETALHLCLGVTPVVKLQFQILLMSYKSNLHWTPGERPDSQKKEIHSLFSTFHSFTTDLQFVFSHSKSVEGVILDEDCITGESILKIEELLKGIKHKMKSANCSLAVIEKTCERLKEPKQVVETIIPKLIMNHSENVPTLTIEKKISVHGKNEGEQTEYESFPIGKESATKALDLLDEVFIAESNSEYEVQKESDYSIVSPEIYNDHAAMLGELQVALKSRAAYFRRREEVALARMTGKEVSDFSSYSPGLDPELTQSLEPNVSEPRTVTPKVRGHAERLKYLLSLKNEMQEDLDKVEGPNDASCTHAVNVKPMSDDRATPAPPPMPPPAPPPMPQLMPECQVDVTVYSLPRPRMALPDEEIFEADEDEV